jgi:hypothetical protein
MQLLMEFREASGIMDRTSQVVFKKKLTPDTPEKLDDNIFSDFEMANLDRITIVKRSFNSPHKE